MLFGVFPALLTVLLGAAYFFGVDADPQVALARNVALIVSGLWLVIVTRKLHQALAQAARAVDLATAHANQEAAAAPAPAVVVAPAPVAPPASPTAAGPDSEEALSLLSLLQEKGRLLDFLMDDVSRYPDAQVGAAARVVHQGCSSVIREYFGVEPLHAGEEGSPLTLDKDYDAHSYRLIGRVTGEAPFQGRVLHRGWLTTGVKLPKRTPDRATGAAGQTRGGQIITPAEVELS